LCLCRPYQTGSSFYRQFFTCILSLAFPFTCPARPAQTSCNRLFSAPLIFFRGMLTTNKNPSFMRDMKILFSGDFAAVDWETDTNKQSC
jgi:hypothetical protein